MLRDCYNPHGAAGCGDCCANSGSQGIGSSPRIVLPPVESQDSKILEPLTQEKIVELMKPEVQERIIEVPEKKYVEKFVEVPQKVVKERIIHVPKPVIYEVVKTVKKPAIQETVIEIPEIKTVDKVVEVPSYVYEEKIIKIPKVIVQERVIPVPKSIIKEKICEVPTIDYKDLNHEVDDGITLPEGDQVPAQYIQVHNRPYDIEKVVEVPHVQHVYRNIMAPHYRHIPKPVEVPMTHYRPIPVEKIIDRNVPVPVELLIIQEYLCPKIQPIYKEHPVPIHVQRVIEHPVPKESMNNPQLLPLYYQGSQNVAIDGTPCFQPIQPLLSLSSCCMPQRKFVQPHINSGTVEVLRQGGYPMMPMSVRTQTNDDGRSILECNDGRDDRQTDVSRASAGLPNIPNSPVQTAYGVEHFEDTGSNSEARGTSRPYVQVAVSPQTYSSVAMT